MNDPNDAAVHYKNSRHLLPVFVLLLVSGFLNKIFLKLQMIPMWNYPSFVNLLSTFIYVPVCLMYVIPMIACGKAITDEQRKIPKYKFAIMGFLDGCGGTLVIFAVVYLSGPLISLLGQSSIPISMIISKLMLRKKYSMFKYLGAIIVTGGLVVVLSPTFSGKKKADHDTIFWSFIFILSVLPIALSSVYKEKILHEVDLDPVYLNAWVSFFQCVVCLPLAIPVSMLSEPPLNPSNFFANVGNGIKCYLGTNTILGTDHPDHCEKSFLLVTFCIMFNVIFNIALILVLKYGSANLAFLASTIMLPLGNIAYSLKFMPNSKPLQMSDITGLLFIMWGLFLYRFLEDIIAYTSDKKKFVEEQQLDGSSIALLPDSAKNINPKKKLLNK